MNKNHLRFLPLLAVPFLVWMFPIQTEKEAATFSEDKVNLALRKTADGLLRDAGDSTSRISAVEKASENVWRVRLEKPFSYEKLPVLLQNAFDLHEIKATYEVKIRRCDDATIDLGYHQMDFLKSLEAAPFSDTSAKNEVPCKGRAIPDGCHFIEITFLNTGAERSFWETKAAFFGLFLAGTAGFWFFQNRKKRPAETVETAEEIEKVEKVDWLHFGNSKLDAAGQTLFCGGERQKLTFREAKLLRLFAENQDRLLERDFILQQVWADEGILVGRSVDMFISRLRKKMAVDSSLKIVAIHGIGYRLEVEKLKY